MKSQPIYVQREGRDHAGTYRVEAHIVKVTSPFGSRSGPTERKQPKEVAQALLGKIVEDFYRAT